MFLDSRLYSRVIGFRSSDERIIDGLPFFLISELAQEYWVGSGIVSLFMVSRASGMFASVNDERL